MICTLSIAESSDEANPPAAVTHIVHQGQPIVHEYVVQPPPEHHFVAEQQVHHYKPVILANGQTPQTVVHVHHVVNEEARQIDEMDDAEYYDDQYYGDEEEGEEYYDDENYYGDEEYEEYDEEEADQQFYDD